jgi:hypothetical protein
MDQHEVIVQRIVSPDGKVVAEVTSSAKASGDSQSKISQSISVSVSSSNGESRASQSGYSSVSCSN